jgi:cytosine/uracil/thiamine/allantoin permease
MRNLSKKGITYEKGWKHSALLAFLMGTSITLPFAVFRVTPEGPAQITSIFDSIKFIFGAVLSGAGIGLVSVLVAVMFINQFYPKSKN